MVDASRICFIVWKNMSEEVSIYSQSLKNLIFPLQTFIYMLGFANSANQMNPSCSTVFLYESKLRFTVYCCVPIQIEILPCALFTSKTLVKLTLGSHIDLGNIPSGVSLPALKSLFINTIFFTYGDLCNVLLPGCPVLEELSVRHVNCERIPFCISSRSIKKLSVYYNFETVITDMSGMSSDSYSCFC